MNTEKPYISTTELRRLTARHRWFFNVNSVCIRFNVYTVRSDDKSIRLLVRITALPIGTNPALTQDFVKACAAYVFAEIRNLYPASSAYTVMLYRFAYFHEWHEVAGQVAVKGGRHLVLN